MERDKFKVMEGMLYNYKTMQQQINNLKLEIEYLKNNYSGCGSIGYSERSGSTNEFKSTVENEIIKKEKKIERLQREISYKDKQLKKVDNALMVLDDTQRELINLRYIDGQGKISWYRICEQLNLSKTSCNAYKNKAIEALIEIVIN